MWTSASGGGRVSVRGLGVGAGRASTAVAAAVFLVLPAPDRRGRGSTSWPGPAAAAPSPSRAPWPATPASRRALPSREPDRPDPGRRLPGLRRQPRHGPAGPARSHGGHAGAGPAPVLLGGRDLRHLGRPELDRHAPAPPAPSARARRSCCRSPPGDNPAGQTDLQTFYVASATADLVFHAESADQLWFPPSTVYYSGRRDHRVADRARAAGAIYTVESRVNNPTPQASSRGRRRGGPPAGDATAATPTCPTRTPRSRPWRSPSRRGPPRRTTGCRP